MKTLGGEDAILQLFFIFNFFEYVSYVNSEAVRQPQPLLVQSKMFLFHLARPENGVVAVQRNCLSELKGIAYYKLELSCHTLSPSANQTGLHPYTKDFRLRGFRRAPGLEPQKSLKGFYVSA
jgi:hypothetical protein